MSHLEPNSGNRLPKLPVFPVYRVFLSRPACASSQVPAELPRCNSLAPFWIFVTTSVFTVRILLVWVSGSVESFMLECASAATEDRFWLHTLLLI